ncbi:MAG: sugar transferase [Hyphomicrobiales bacterium]|nr:sugar transferase [Hyphomicrobiales bacterium]MBV9753703.1 sugar transferase [Hyphomicrobiales bacterium]
MTLIHLTALSERRAPRTPDIVRRALDVTIALAALLVFSPVMLLIVLAIWMNGSRPIFFSQLRLGLRGRHFRIYKFQKFHNRCGAASGAVTVENDPRFTRLGRFLGKTKLDELPQLWNILKGDMSIVGPRPESLELAHCFSGIYLRVLQYRPGLFGPNQVLFRNESSMFPDNYDPEKFYCEYLFPLKANIDLAYFPHRTLAKDMGWIIRGLLAVAGWQSPPSEDLQRTLNEGRSGWNWQQAFHQPSLINEQVIQPGE